MSRIINYIDIARLNIIIAFVIVYNDCFKDINIRTTTENKAVSIPAPGLPQNKMQEHFDLIFKDNGISINQTVTKTNPPIVLGAAILSLRYLASQML